MYRRGGYYCICRGCPSKTGRGLSFFTIPKDSSRASWLRTCNREDLLDINPEKCHNYRLCELHFEDKCLSKGGRKALFSEAVPTLFPITFKRVTDEVFQEPCENVIVLSLTSARKSPSPGPSGMQHSPEPTTSPPFTSCSTQRSTPGSSGMQHSPEPPTSALFTSCSTQWSTPGPSGMQHSKAPEFLEQTPPSSPSLSTSTLSTQTPARLTAGTPRKTKLRMKIKTWKQRQGKAIKQQKLEPTLAEFYTLCDKFLSKPLAEILKTQALLKQRKCAARRYSANYKQFALTLFF